MTIRSRLLALLLPTLILFVSLSSVFYFINWNHEITESFRSNLQSIVVTSAELINSNEIEWILNHRNDANVLDSAIYKKNLELFKDLRTKLPVDNLFVISIEPVRIGERVMLDHPPGENNPIYNGSNPAYAFRQIYLIDTESSKIEQDFSETNEYLVYSTKKPLLTPIYRGISSHEQFMTGYAPIMNDQKEVIALVGADVNMNLLHRIEEHAIWVMLIAAFITILLVTTCVVFIANKITSPVSQLKNAALALAAGEYDEKIGVKGPKEIAELANTFNTMRECLLDHINRLRDSSFLREKLFGEQECALLLQNRMLDGIIERFEDPRISIRHITSAITGPMRGLKLDMAADTASISVTLTESIDEGFDGVYSLVSNSPDFAGKLTSRIEFPPKSIVSKNNNMPTPLLWSLQQGRFLPDNEGPLPFEKGDYLFLFNQEMLTIFPHRQTIRDWIGKVMRQFAKENLDLLTVMLTSELNFWIKKSNASPHIHLFCIQIH